MTVTVDQVGTPTSATGSATAPAPAFPATVNAGTLARMYVSIKPFSATMSAPTGWTVVATSTNGSTAGGTNTGSERGYIFELNTLTDGTEDGASVSISIPSGDSASAVIITYASDTGTFDTEVVAFGNKVGNSANMSATTTTQTSWAAGDLAAVVFFMNASLGTPSADTLTHTGVTFGTVTNRADRAVTTGNDSRLRVNTAPVSSVTTPSGGSTGGYTNASSTSGLLAVERLRSGAPSTVPVTATRATTWNTDESVTATRATTWNADAAVTATKATTWDALAVTAGTRATTWDVLSATTATRATSWDTLARTTSTRATTWNTRAAVTSSRATTWDVLGRVTGSRATTWDALALVSATRATLWNVASSLLSVTASRATSWRVAARVTGTRSTTWDVLSRVTGSRPTSWDVLTPAATTRATSWRVLQRIAALRTTLWNVLDLGSPATPPNITVVTVDPPRHVATPVAPPLVAAADTARMTTLTDPPRHTSEAS